MASEIEQKLTRIAQENGVSLSSFEFANLMDSMDPCSNLRNDFFYPKMKTMPGVDLELVNPEEDSVYFSGNTLGLEPKGTKTYIHMELKKWAEIMSEDDSPWMLKDEEGIEGSNGLVGAVANEVALMNSRSVNLHLLLVSFYRPSSCRYKILLESKVWPTDHFVLQSQIKLHGLDPAECMICVKPREGEFTLRIEDIGEILEKEGESIALVLFSGINYYTGQLYHIQKITQLAQEKGCHVGWDVSNAMGNVPLKLHEWNVDFAVWSNTRYVNSGPGGVAGIFIHQRFALNDFPRFAGWWGEKLETRFRMNNMMNLTPGAFGYRVSNPPLFLVCLLKASLDIFAKTTMAELREKSVLLTGYLECLMEEFFGKNSECSRRGGGRVYCELMTPRNPEERGCQMTFKFSVDLSVVFEELIKRGVSVSDFHMYTTVIQSR